MRRANVLFYGAMTLMIVGAVSISFLAAAPILAKPTTGGVDHVYLTISTQPGNGLDWYTPANFSVPAGEDLQITVINYDDGINNVSGMPANTSHTFTIEALGVSVPIPAAADAFHPSVTTFNLGVLVPGEYHWICLAPCDPGAMGKPGYMAGTISVL